MISLFSNINAFQHKHKDQHVAAASLSTSDLNSLQTPSVIAQTYPSHCEALEDQKPHEWLSKPNQTSVAAVEEQMLEEPYDLNW